MNKNQPKNTPLPKGAERRREERHTVTLDVEVRLSSDGMPLEGECLDIGPNGLRISTKMPLPDSSYIFVAFKGSSNNTRCEGRVVWSQPSHTVGGPYECGVDVQRWGGDMPQDPMHGLIPDV